MEQAQDQVAADAELLREYEARAKTKPWTIYPLTCVPAILPWHESKAHIRVLAGPNRGGKTTAGAFEIICYATGYNPIRDEHYPTPNICWAVAIDYDGTSGRVLIRKIREMCPPGTKYHRQKHIFTLPAPWHSEIHLKTQQEGREHFYGEGCTAIWIDEGKEGEIGEENFNEMLMRRIPGQPLNIFVTLTPLNGYDWLWRRLWNEKAEEFIQGTFRHRFTIEDCYERNGGFWSEQEVNAFSANYKAFERAARMLGDFTPFGNSPFFSIGQLLRAVERAPHALVGRMRMSSLSGTRFEEVEDGPCKLFRPKESGHQYIAAWDPSSGVGGDYSAFVVLDRNDLAEVFHSCRRDMPPKEFAEQVVLPASSHYNEALLAIEVNGEGGGAAIEAVRNEYGNLYMMQNWNKATATMTQNIGWRTLGSGMEGTRGRMLDAVTRALREGSTFSAETIEQMSHVVIKQSDSGKKKAEHADGFHDDLVMAWGMGAAIHYEEPLWDYPPMSRLRVRYQEQGILATP